MLSVFVLLRQNNIYGDPRPWKAQDSTVYSILAFLNVTKYPPSLNFALLFLGIMFLLLGLAERFSGKWERVITIYGSVPLFYYILHLLLIRIAVFIMVFAQGFSWKDMSFAPFQFGRPAEPSGINLGWVYVVWIAIVILLYPLCKWYSDYKTRHKEKSWLHYL